MPALVRNNNMQTYHGYAAQDNSEEDRILQVYSEEALPFFKGNNGNLEGMCVKASVKTTGNDGTFEGEIPLSNCFRCVYRDDSSSGSTPPLVRKGEQVLIYNYGDNDTWYWKSEGRNDNNRRTDIWRKAISGTLENAPELNDDNSYFIELDTRKTHRIRISTSKADGEEFRYLLMLDAGNSQIYLGDDQNNQIFIDSKEHRVGLRNNDDSLLMLDKKNIVMACEEDITITSKNGSVNTQSAKDTNIDSKQAMKINSTGPMTQTTDSSYAMGFKGGGTFSGNGSNMSMTIGHLDINQG